MGDYPNDEDMANAEFIVRACNNYDRLLKAAQRVVATANKIPSEAGPEPQSIIELRGAIPKAEWRGK